VDRGVVGEGGDWCGRSVVAKCIYLMKKLDFRHSTSFKIFSQERKFIK
jgi:hypothetical protein